MRKIFLLLSVSLITVGAFSQDFSNKGKDFWVGYGSHVSMYNANGTLNNSGGSQDMVLYFTSDVLANVTVTIPATGWTRNYTVIPPPLGTGLVETQAIPKTGTDDARLGVEQKYLKKGIHITSDKPIVAYAHIYNGSISGATLLFPTNTLGKEYYSLNYTQKSNSQWSYPYTFVIATEDSTIIQTTTTGNTQTRTAGVMKLDTLMQGDVLNLLGQLLTNTTNSSTGVELTGTKIKSVATSTGQCKKIAVFSGSGKLGITCPAGTGGSADNYIQQCFPSTAWGKKYYTVPTKDLTFNYFRVMVKDPATIVKLNGIVQAGLINNTYYDLALTNVPNLIEADQPIMVAQMITTQSTCGNGSPGDPEMIYLSSIEQTIEKVTLNSTTHAAITKHYINVVIKASGVASFRLDNAIPATPFTAHPQDPNYKYAQFTVSAGVHQLQSDSGFTAIAYGYGSAESYGYNAGTNIRDLYTFITPINPLSIATTNSTCSGTPFYFAVTYPYQPLSLQWNFYNAMGYPNVTVANPATINDSTYFINGKQVWRYKLPTPYFYSPAGNYPVSITAETSGSDGCGSFQVRDDTLYIFDPGNAAFTFQNNGCAADSVSFSDITQYPTGSGLYNYQWQWDFGDPTSGTNNTATSKTPKHKFSAPGTYNVTLTALDNIGCYTNSITKQVFVTEIPVAKFGISSPICAGLPVTFSDTSSAISPATLVKWYWDFGDGFKTVRTTNSDTIHTYSPWNPAITDTLTVETNSGCKSAPFYRTFKVNPIPVSNFTMPAGICLPADSAHFIATSTIADATGGFAYIWNFGDPASGVNNGSVIPNPAHYYNNPGPFSIKLTTTSAAGCVHDSIKVLSTVYPLALAGMTVAPENCLNDITSFTDNSNGSGNTVTQWFWDFGDATPVNNTQNPTHTYTTSGVKTIKHWIKTNVGCTSDTATTTITINPLPTASFTHSGPYCISKDVTFTDASVPNAGTIANWHWDLGDGTILNYNNGAPFTHQYAAAGPYTVKLTVTTDKGCVSALYSTVVTVQPLPAPSFTNSLECLPYGITNFTNTSTIPSAVAMNYTWSFGDPASGASNTSALVNPTHYFSTVGPYPVILTATSFDGCISSVTQQVSNIYPQPTSAFSLAAEDCLNNVTAFTSNASGNGSTITEYHWDFGDGNFSTAASPTHTYATAGTKTVKHWIVTDKGCYSDTTTHTIVINPLPTASFTHSGPYCVTKDITFTDASVPNAGVIANWYWDLGDGTILNYNTAAPFTHQYAATGPFTVKLTVTTNKGCVSALYSTVVNVQPLPVPSFTNSIECLPYTITTFTNTSTIPSAVAMNYTWSFGDPASGVNNTSALVNPTHYFSTVGPYSVILTATSIDGCISSGTQQVNNIYPHPTSPFAVGAENCLNTTTSFTSNADGNGSAIFEYHWDFGDGNFSTVANPTHTYATSGTKTIKHWIITDKGCYSDTTTHTVVINPLPTPDFTYTIPSCETRVITFTDASVANAGILNNWQWNFGDATTGAGTPVTKIYTAAGTYTVTLTVTTDKGCVSNPIASKTVVINDRPLAGYIIPEVCLSDTYAQFTDTSKIANGNITAWAWNFGDPNATVPNPNTSIVQHPQHSYTAVGMYPVQLIATSNAGCKDTITQNLVINGSFPVANFTVNNPATLCANDSVAIVNASTVFPGTITKVEIYWDNVNFPVAFQLDDYPYSGKVYRHLYANFQNPLTKTFTIRFRAYSGGVCVNDKISTITVNAAPKVQFNNMPDACYDAVPFQITQASEIGGVPGSGVYTGAGVSPTGIFNPAAAGIGLHFIKYTYTSTAAGCVDTITRAIKVIDTASAQFSFISPTCEGSTSTFKDESTAPSGVTLSNTVWDFGDGSPLANHVPGSIFTHTYLAAGTYTVKMYTTSAYGCKSTTRSRQIIISPIPTTAFAFKESSVCIPNASVSFINNSTIADGSEAGFLYLWNFGDITSGPLNNSLAKTPPAHLYSGTGPYTVTLTVTSDSGCVKTTSKPVDFIHPQPTTSFTMSKPGVCLGDPVTFTDISNGLDGTVTQWYWDFGDGVKASTSPVSYLYKDTLLYNISLYIVNSHGCSSDPVTQPFTVYPYPAFDAGPDQVVLEGGSTTLSPNIIRGTLLQYLWTPATYLNDNTVVRPLATNMLDDITYTLQLTGRGGCVAPTDKVFIKILKAPQVPNTFTPNGDGINEMWKIEYLDTYPNCKVQVFTRNGQQVFESKGYKTPWDGTIKGKALPFDTYYYIIEPGNGRKPITGYVTIMK
ncbi:MAG: PKD domain-containing protein [Ferruginibacter sp.]